jgi:hypothetical protein
MLVLVLPRTPAPVPVLLPYTAGPAPALSPSTPALLLLAVWPSTPVPSKLTPMTP